MADGNKKVENASSYQDKLEAINQELLILENCCLRHGMTPLQIEKSASRFLKDVKTSERHRGVKILLMLGVVIGLASVLVCYEPTYRQGWSVGRSLLIKVHKLWDWTSLYKTECLVNNPRHQSDEYSTAGPEDCPLCENITQVDIHRNITMEKLSTTYLNMDVPVIVADGIRDWPNKDQINIPYLDKLYNEHEVLMKYMPCWFDSNIDVPAGNHRQFLKQAGAGEIDNYYAVWKNCFKETAKSLRKIFRRPYCLPPMVQLLDISWILVSHNYKPSEPQYMSVPQDAQLQMLIQLSGEITVKLHPDNCSSVCKTIEKTLNPGNILFATDFLYELAYKPRSLPNTVTLVLSGSLH